jgi:hypothetical protein
MMKKAHNFLDSSERPEMSGCSSNNAFSQANSARWRSRRRSGLSSSSWTINYINFNNSKIKKIIIINNNKYLKNIKSNANGCLYSDKQSVLLGLFPVDWAERGR